MALGALETAAKDPFYRLRQEKWLESRRFRSCEEIQAQCQKQTEQIRAEVTATQYGCICRTGLVHHNI